MPKNDDASVVDALVSRVRDHEKRIRGLEKTVNEGAKKRRNPIDDDLFPELNRGDDENDDD